MTKRELVDAFLKRFALGDDEVKILSGLAATPVTPTARKASRRANRAEEGALPQEFFDALAHLHQISTDVKVLLMADNHRAG